MSYECLKVGLGRLNLDRPRTGRVHGHNIIVDKDGTIRWCDDLSELDRNNLRACPKCLLNPSEYDGQDPCMANLPGVRNACCGHGKDPAYIEFEDGRMILGGFTIGGRKPHAP